MKDENLKKVTLNLNRESYARLGELHPQTPRAEIIRLIVDAYIAAAQQSAAMILDRIKEMP